MRRIIFFSLLFAGFASWTGCEKTDDISVSNVSTVAQTGNWRIAYFSDDGRDETSNYTSDRFVFGSGGTITATAGASTFTGNWASYKDDGVTKLNIDFTAPARLLELTDDWDVVEVNNNMISLRDVSGGSGGTDWLRFER
jgi:hypothetical protein